MTPYKLLLKGGKKKLEEYIERAREDGLEIVLFTDQKVEIETKITVSTDEYPAALLNLPDRLKKTALTIYDLKYATAQEVADQTKRSRATESICLKQLVTMDMLKKETRGRKLYFYVEK